MEKVIWVIGDDRAQMIDAQRKINGSGSMRAVCMLSFAAVKKSVDVQRVGERSLTNSPSLIVVDFETAKRDEFKALTIIRQNQALAGVPLVFLLEDRSKESDDDCYDKGAVLVLHKPLGESGIFRMERMAWQYEVTKNYEKMLHKQAGDLQSAREIMRLNQQLEARNELLYQIFGRYFSDKVLEEILEKPQGATIGGEKRELTVMMADLRGFTRISEELEPEELLDVLNCFFSKMVEAIKKYQGTVIEFLGDAILAVFGAPLVTESHVKDAVAAAITMQNSMREVNKYCMEKCYPMLEMGIGLHKGDVFIGNIGSEKMMRYNVIGSAVNECSRIESFSVGGEILISKQSLKGSEYHVRIGKETEIMVKGIKEPICVCEVTGIAGEYQCYPENIFEDIWENFEFNNYIKIYPLDGKVRENHFYEGRILACSHKAIIVELNDDLLVNSQESDVETLPELAVYSDVEISGSLQMEDKPFVTGEDGFAGLYAKVVSREKSRLTLHYTGVSKSFRRILEVFFGSRASISEYWILER